LQGGFNNRVEHLWGEKAGKKRKPGKKLGSEKYFLTAVAFEKLTMA